VRLPDISNTTRERGLKETSRPSVKSWTVERPFLSFIVILLTQDWRLSG